MGFGVWFGKSGVVSDKSHLWDNFSINGNHEGGDGTIFPASVAGMV